jgi:hypothetical protein
LRSLLVSESSSSRIPAELIKHGRWVLPFLVGLTHRTQRLRLL